MAVNHEIQSSEVTIKINLHTNVITVTDEKCQDGQTISRPELEDIANDPERGLRWNLSVYHYPGSNCYVIHMPGGDRVFCT